MNLHLQDTATATGANMGRDLKPASQAAANVKVRISSYLVEFEFDKD